MALTDVDDLRRRFLQQLFTETDGDCDRQVSMYDVGTSLGLDRSEASRVAEDLIASELVEIRTLAGAIGIHPGAVEDVRELLGVGAPASEPVERLGSTPVLTESGKRVLDVLTGEVKAQVGLLGLEFEVLSEIMADLKTIDSQLESPHPKTAVFRECLSSISDNLVRSNATELANRIKASLEG